MREKRGAGAFLRIHPRIGEIGTWNFSVHFFACPKKRTKERAPGVPCPAEGGIPGVYAPHGVLLNAAGALQTRCAQTVQPPFSAAFPVLGCVPMGVFSSHLSCRASQTGAEKTRELSEGEARVFPRPALGEKQGKPAGPGLVGVPFSCFFFWARKRRKRTQQKDLSSLEIPG